MPTKRISSEMMNFEWPPFSPEDCECDVVFFAGSPFLCHTSSMSRPGCFVQKIVYYDGLWYMDDLRCICSKVPW